MSKKQIEHNKYYYEKNTEINNFHITNEDSFNNVFKSKLSKKFKNLKINTEKNTEINFFHITNEDSFNIVFKN